MLGGGMSDSIFNSLKLDKLILVLMLGYMICEFEYSSWYFKVTFLKCLSQSMCETGIVRKASLKTIIFNGK